MEFCLNSRENSMVNRGLCRRSVGLCGFFHGFLLAFRSFIRISGFAEDTLAWKIANKFAFSLAYSYLCRQIHVEMNQ